MEQWYFKELSPADATYLVAFANRNQLEPGEVVSIREDLGDPQKGIAPSVRFMYYAERELN